ncbi:hypothetical protein LCGC14_2341270, partial [marine sediment metagenome]
MSESGMTSFELPLSEPSPPPPPDGLEESLAEPLLVQNVIWFCRLRWVVAAILLAFGLLGLWAAGLRFAGLKPPGSWPFVLAGVLAVCNVLYLAQARRLRQEGEARHVKMNLWSQIVLDLIVLTVVVYFVGARQSFVAFTYLYHIVLACIFFSVIRSLVVTLLASGLYIGCVAAEWAGAIPEAGIYDGPPLGPLVGFSSPPEILNLASAIGIWLVVWYLGSHLSGLVRRRDTELARTNQRLVAALAERARHMLRTTHELKSPFAAIHAYTQVLRDGYCGPLSEEASRVVLRISARCRRLANEIQEMLQLANLHSTSQHLPQPERLDLADILRWCVDQVRPLADRREIGIDQDFPPTSIVGVPDHLKMLLSNLLLNAVNYSQQGGRVRLACRGVD